MPARAGCTPSSVAHTDPFRSSLDGTTMIDGKESPVMVESTERPRPRRHADRADLGSRPLLPRRRQPGPRRRRAAALRRAQLAADRRGLGAALLLPRDDRRRSPRASSAASSTRCCRASSTCSGPSRSTCWRSRSRSCCSPRGIDASGRSRIGAGSLWLPIVHHRHHLRPLRRAADPRAGAVAAREASSSLAAIGLGARELAASCSRRPAQRRHRRVIVFVPLMIGAQHADRVGALVPLDRRAAARRELGHDHPGRPGPALHAAVGRARARPRHRRHRALRSTCSATACATRSTRAPSLPGAADDAGHHRPPAVRRRAS